MKPETFECLQPTVRATLKDLLVKLEIYNFRFGNTLLNKEKERENSFEAIRLIKRGKTSSKI